MVYSLASSIAGIGSGIALGMMGSFVGLDVRVAVASLLTLVAIGLGSVELLDRRVQPLQCNHETPQQWVDEGPFRWAIKNGLTLGCGATSRIEFWLWYVIPFGALLVATPLGGAAIYGVYGFLRGVAVWAIIAGLHLRRNKEGAAWLLRYTSIARTIAAGQLLFVGAVVAVVIGL